MNSTARARRGGRLWPVVLVASALALIASGWQLSSDREAAAQLPEQTQLAPPPAGTPSARPSSTSTKPRAVPRGWSTHDAKPLPVPRTSVPERLVIDDVSISIPIVPVGVDRQGSMALPERPDRAGWYSLGPAPGDAAGSAVIAAHVDSVAHGTGPLASLAALGKGDVVRIEGDRDLRFRVIGVQRISKRSLNTGELFARTGEPVLRLVTCGGAFDPERGYRDNVVVTAVPVQGGR